MAKKYSNKKELLSYAIKSITADGRNTEVRITTNNGEYVGTARCNASDEYDAATDVVIAEKRAIRAAIEDLFDEVDEDIDWLV